MSNLFPDLVDDFDIILDKDGECPDNISNLRARLVIRVNILTGCNKSTEVGVSNKFYIAKDGYTCETSLEDILSETDKYLTSRDLKRKLDGLGVTECAVVRNRIAKLSSGCSDRSTMTLEAQTLVRNQS